MCLHISCLHTGNGTLDSVMEDAGVFGRKQFQTKAQCHPAEGHFGPVISCCAVLSAICSRREVDIAARARSDSERCNGPPSDTSSGFCGGWVASAGGLVKVERFATDMFCTVDALASSATECCQ